MSTRSGASAVHSDASDPGSSRTVVRMRQSAVAVAWSVACGPASAGTSVSGCSDCPARSVGSRRASVSPVGGAWLWRRAHHVWNPAVASSTTAETASSTGPSGPWPTRFATASATATAVNRAASSTTSRRQWWTGRPFLVRLTSDMSGLMQPL